MPVFALACALLLNFLIPALSSTSLPRRASRYDGAQVLTIQKDPHLDELIRQNDLDVWKSNLDYLEVMVPKNKLHLTSFLSKHDIPYSVKIENLGEAINRENPPTLSTRMARNTPSFNNYQRLGEIHQYLDHLASAYPQIASVGIMGYSEERRPLKYIKISSGKNNAKSVFIDGGIHAREWVSPASVTYIIKELVENRQNLPAELLNLDFYILPVLNPDGYEYTHTNDRMWRKNRSKNGRCPGADINRNFNFHFGGEGTSGDACSEIYRGRSPSSELETQALTSFLQKLKGSLKAYITFHSYGQYILIPYGYQRNSLAPNYNEMKRVADEAARAMRRIDGSEYVVGNTANTLYPAAGGSDDWTKSQIGPKYVYTIELRDNGDHGFVLPAKYILPTAREAFEAIKVIASAASKA